MERNLDSERRVFFSTGLASVSGSRFALAAVVISAAIFLVTAPFATIQLVPIPAFIPAYESALVICDLITAVLLFSQFNFLRSRALYVLANGYLFTALVALVHALSFPGVFSPAGLLGGGSQTTAWLYMFWHAGFPLFIIGYAVLKDQQRDTKRASGANGLLHAGTGVSIAAGAVSVAAIVWALTFVATANTDLLPVLIFNNRFTTAMKGVVSGLWAASLVALAALLWRRPYTVLDLWLMVVMCAWFFDIALSATLNAGRFDLGWYGGRIYGLLAASFLLIVLLIENATHYARLAQLSAELGEANESLKELSLHDGLTNLANRRYFDSYLADQIAVARRHDRTLALVLVDVDAFKAYNDRYGHQAGDESLKKIAAALQTCCRRPGDMAARYGGEEFAIILPDTGLIGAAQVAEAARAAIEELRIPHLSSAVGPHLSISGGVAVVGANAGTTAEQLIAAADQFLFQAKNLGRNRIVSKQGKSALDQEELQLRT